MGKCLIKLKCKEQMSGTNTVLREADAKMLQERSMRMGGDRVDIWMVEHPQCQERGTKK